MSMRWACGGMSRGPCSRRRQKLTYTSRTAEFTTVILASAFPTMPRLLQWLRERNNPASRSQSDQRPPKPSYPEHSTRSDVEAGGPWDGSGSMAAILTGNYIRLEEQPRADGLAPDLGLQRDKSEGIDLAPLTYPLNPQAQDNKGVRKTVRGETHYSAPDHLRPPHRTPEASRQGAVT